MNASLILKIIGIVLVVAVLAGWFFFRFALEKDFALGVKFKIPEDGEYHKSYFPDENEAKFFYDNAYKKEVVCKDRLKLVGYLLKAKDSHKYIIMCHGFLGSHKEMIKNALYLNKKGFNCLLVDARAHGDSQGRYRGMGYLERIDMLYWIDMIMKQDKDCKIALYGRSMGATTVMFTACEETMPENVKCVVEDCGYGSVDDEFKYQITRKYHLPSFPIVIMASELCKSYAKYSFEEANLFRIIDKNPYPTLFIHGDQDDFVPYENLDMLYDRATCEKEKYVVEGAGHCFAFIKDPEKYYDTMLGFINRHMSSD